MVWITIDDVKELGHSINFLQKSLHCTKIYFIGPCQLHTSVDFLFALVPFKLIFTLIKWILNTIKLFLEQYTREKYWMLLQREAR